MQPEVSWLNGVRFAVRMFVLYVNGMVHSISRSDHRLFSTTTTTMDGWTLRPDVRRRKLASN